MRTIIDVSLSARLAALACAVATLASSASAQVMTRASVSTGGAEGDMASVFAEISLDGRWAVFESDASNLVLADTNRVRDAFARDRLTGTTILVSQSSAGEIGGFLSTNPDVSSVGPFVAFESPAFNLVPNDTNASTDVFVRDLTNGITTLVSADSSGTLGDRNSFNPSISDDGRYVAFDSSSTNLVALDTNGNQDVFVRDLLAMTTIRVSVSSTGGQANDLSGSPAISGDGRFVAFISRARNLVDGDANNRQDVFLHEIATRTTQVVSLSTSGVQPSQDCFAPAISFDGRYVAFQSSANNLVPGDTNVQTDVFVRDVLAGTLERVSVSSAGAQASGACSAPAISADGRYVAFQSSAPNLVPGDGNAASDVFLRDRALGTTIRLTSSAACGDVDGGSTAPSISADGAIVAFQSTATDLVENDGNAVSDVFVRDGTVLSAERVIPAVGSEAGGEVARIVGVGFGSAGSTQVFFGATPATVLSASAVEIRVLTPPGTGDVEVSVSGPGGCAIVPGSFSYVDAGIAARFGNVNLGIGDRENVLLVNGRAGNLRRELSLSVADPFRVEMLSPSSRAVSKFLLYVWVGEPDATTVSRQPGGIGNMVFPTPMTGGAPQPRRIWNNIGIEETLGVPSFPSSAAPSVLLDRPPGSLVPLRVAFQGIVQDNGSLIRQRHSVTNAVFVRVE